MKAFIKTLIGDTNNVAAVIIAILVELAATRAGEAVAAAFITPLVILSAATWLARR